MLVPCANRCGSKLDPAQLPGGMCRHCFAQLPTDQRTALARQFREARARADRPPEKYRPVTQSTGGTRHSRPNRSSNRSSRRGGRSVR